MLSISDRRALRAHAPRTQAQLQSWVWLMLGLHAPARPLIAGHDAPFAYLCHSFFESARPPEHRNALVWAGRGSGKTCIGAVATLLDLLFKPGIQICILGGSFAQSSRMHAHLKRMLDDEALADLVEGRLTRTGVRLRNGSCVEVLGQSQTAVRGRRVHRLRCDEVELFDPEVWEAAQMVTRSGRCGEVDVAAGIESFSTMHQPFGLMSRLIADAANARTRVFRWSVIDVLEPCPSSRTCSACPLFADGCGGVAKRPQTAGAFPQPGFFHIEDAIDQRSRISPEAWRSEMLCLRPNLTDTVYPTFSEQHHVFNDGHSPPFSEALKWIGGIDFGFRSPTVVLLAALDGSNCVHVLDEIVERGMPTPQVIERVIERFARLSQTASESNPARLTWLGADPAGLARSDQTGVSSIALWRRAGFVVRTRASSIEAGIEIVRTRLRAADGSIGLRVHERCVQLIRALREYHYPPNRPQAEQPVKDGPDHACDALRYMLINLERGADVCVRGY